MKIALINESSTVNKNSLILKELKDVAEPMGHQVFNYGMNEEEKDFILNYVEIGYLAAILLNSKAADFVVTGCASGEGACMVSNSYPNVYCGYIKDPVDACLFGQINDGNAMSLAYSKDFGLGAELNLRYLFREYFSTTHGGGYPENRASLQREFKVFFKEMKACVCSDMGEVIRRTKPEVTKRVTDGRVFKKNFFQYAENNSTTIAVKEVMDGERL